MKTALYYFSAIFFPALLPAQDVIVRNDSNRIHASVLEINPNQVIYRLSDYAGGPRIIENKSQLAYIIFPNGSVERFPKTQFAARPYHPNQYNIDRVPVKVYDPEARQKKHEALYQYRNYVGFNYISFINATFGVHYMRDFRKAHLLLDVPLAVGLGRPSITNSIYGRNYLDGTEATQYKRMNYQAGLSALFTSSVKLPLNVLMGPSFTFSEYRMNMSVVKVTNGVQTELSNNFKLYRAHYGVSLGLMARYTAHFNMCMLLTMGYKQDSYDQKDPYRKAFSNNTNNTMPSNSKAYVNFSWTLGYRF